MKDLGFMIYFRKKKASKMFAPSYVNYETIDRLDFRIAVFQVRLRT